MRKTSILLFCMAAAGGWDLRAATHLKAGDMAPDFTLPSTTGQDFKLSDYRGKSAVVVAFFPAAFTGG